MPFRAITPTWSIEPHVEVLAEKLTACLAQLQSAEEWFPMESIHSPA